jgi:hypothetical protein
MTFALILGLVPAVAITSPAQADYGDLTMTAASGAEGSVITFTMTYTGTGPSTYALSTSGNTATAGTDYTVATNPTTVSFAGGSETKTVSVTTLTDLLDEGDETFTVYADYLGTDSESATGTIEDSLPPPTYQLTAMGPVSEDADGGSKLTRVTATLSAPSAETATIPVRTVDGTAISTGLHPDFVAVESENITVLAGDMTGYIDVRILDDNRNEDAIQSFTVGPVGSSQPPQNTTPLSTEAGTVTIDIEDNDLAPTVDIGGAGVVREGSPLGFWVSLSEPSEKVVTVDVTTTDGTAVAGSDYTALSPLTVSFPAETIGRPAAVPTTSDSVFEVSTETLSATISNPQNATLGEMTTASGGVTDDDPPPTVTLSPISGLEGDDAEATTNVVVTLSAATEVPVEIGYTVDEGTAEDGTDFMSGTGTVKIAAGATIGEIPVEINGDTMDEPNETVIITISTPNMTINNSSVGPKTFTITDDDAMPTYTVGDIALDEGDEADVMQVPVTLSNPSAWDIDLVVSTGGSSDTAESGSGTVGSEDYNIPDTTLRIASGQTEGFIDVTVNGDTVFERAEDITFEVQPATGELMVDSTLAVGGQHSATLTLQNDDAVPTLEFNESTGTEGTFMLIGATVIGSSQYPFDLDLSYIAYGDDAAEITDVQPMEGSGSTSGTIEPGTMAIQFGLAFLNQDTIDEAEEFFQLIATEPGTCDTLARCVTLKAAKATAARTARNGVDSIGFIPVEGRYGISDDPGDLPPTASISDESIVEDEGSVDVGVTLEFKGTTTATEQAFTLPWWTEDGSATAGKDYVAEPDGLLRISPGELTGEINVKLINDKLYERDEQFAVRIGDPGPAGATVGRTVGDITIQSEDAPTAPTMITPSSIKGPGAVAVRGVASPGATVELMLGTFGTSTPLVRKTVARADSNGYYSFTQNIAVATRFGVRADGLNSTVRNVRITQAPTISGSSGATGAVALTVLSNPRLSGQIVYLQRLNANGKWATLVQSKTNSAGAYSTTLRGYRSGTSWSFRAYVVGSTPAGTLSGYSPARRVTIR